MPRSPPKERAKAETVASGMRNSSCHLPPLPVPLEDFLAVFPFPFPFPLPLLGLGSRVGNASRRLGGARSSDMSAHEGWAGLLGELVGADVGMLAAGAGWNACGCGRACCVGEGPGVGGAGDV